MKITYAKAFLIVDRKVLCEIAINEVPLFLVAIFYILNIQYPTGCSNLYSFLEAAFLGHALQVTFWFLVHRPHHIFWLKIPHYFYCACAVKRKEKERKQS